VSSIPSIQHKRTGVVIEAVAAAKATLGVPLTLAGPTP
jgi:hypothetical protein